MFRIAGKLKRDDAPTLRVVDAGELSGPPLRRAMALVTLSWVFGSVWQTSIGGAPFSLFAKDLRASELQIGILAALPFLASLVSMPASLLTERTGTRKRIFLLGLYAQRLLWFPIALTTTSHAYWRRSRSWARPIVMTHVISVRASPTWTEREISFCRRAT